MGGLGAAPRPGPDGPFMSLSSTTFRSTFWPLDVSCWMTACTCCGLNPMAATSATILSMGTALELRLAAGGGGPRGAGTGAGGAPYVPGGGGGTPGDPPTIGGGGGDGYDDG